jgi:subtilisin family serine protease
LFFPFSSLSAQQVLVNRLWDVSYGNPGSLDWSANTLDQNDNLVSTGNTVQSATLTSALITKRDKNGILLWEKTFSIAPVSQNYGVAVCTDLNDNVFVAGVCQNGGTNKDILVLKYDPNGFLIWSQTYDSPNSQDEGAVAITCDPAGGQVFVTGPAMGTITFSDYLTLAFDGGSGNILWQQKYNGPASLPDVPIGITFDNGDVNVIGASGSATYKYDVTTLRYDYTGSLIDSMRYSEPGMKLDQPTALAKDLAGNLYITGSSSTNGVDFDIQTMKLNAADLSLAWVETYDLNGLEDKATSIVINNQGDVFITGYVTVQPGKTELIAIKYDANGNQQWTNRLGRDQTTARGQRCALDPEGNLIIAGVAIKNNVSSWLNYQLETENGALLYERKIVSGNSLEFQPSDIRWVSDDGFIVSGRSALGYRSVYYQRYIQENEIAYDSLGEASHIANQIIVKFDPSIINLSFINDKELLFGEMTDVFDPNFLGDPRLNFDYSRVKVVKIYKRLTLADSSSMSRLGEPVALGQIWSWLALVFESSSEVESALTCFNTMPDLIMHSQINHVYSFVDVPNDPLVTSFQGSLLNNNNPQIVYANIGMEGAWDLETGRDYINVGLYDHKVFYEHEDLGDGTLSGSRVNDGFNYYYNYSLEESSLDALNQHGTKTAGIIGAIRDNGIGVAGIAGGKSNPTGTDGTGVRMQSMILSYNGFVCSDIQISDAILDGAASTTTGYGFGQNVLNLSMELNAPSLENPFLDNNVYIAHRHNCIIVQSRGNDGVSVPNYPTGFNDEWVISVGSSNIKGSRQRSNFPSGSNIDDYSSNFGVNLDLIAPGVSDLVATIKHPSYDLTSSDIEDENYVTFNGTSAAAPHVSGVAALMLGMHNTLNGYDHNLSSEDVENLLEFYATDVVDNLFDVDQASVGYDEKTGWGLLNANDVIHGLVKPRFEVKHFTPNQFSTTSNSIILLPNSPQPYLEAYKITRVFNVNLAGNFVILKGWGRGSSSNSYANWDNVEFKGCHYEMIYNSLEPNKAQVKVTSYCFKNINNGYWSVHPDELVTPFTIYCEDLNYSSTVEMSNLYLNIHPLPANDQLQLSWKTTPKDPALKIFNYMGVLVMDLLLLSFSEEHNIDVSSLPSGNYILQVTDGERLVLKKITVIH